MSSDDTSLKEAGANVGPRHIAIIMDGNGRWAQKRLMPRVFGHRAGVKAVRKIVEQCIKDGDVEVLTLFAFSSENWRRPVEEVSLLMDLFKSSLKSEIEELDRNNIRLRFIGERSRFSASLQQLMAEGEKATQANTGLTLVIAVNYGGRWDISQALRTIGEKVAAGELGAEEINEELIGRFVSTADLPEPDLFIRTGGEQRISNFLLWQLAYTEMYFTETLWPDFDEKALTEAIASFKSRQRRFGHTGEQVLAKVLSF